MWNESRGRILRALSPPGTPTRDGSSSANEDEMFVNFDDDNDNDQPPVKSRRLENGSPKSTSNGRHRSPDSSYHSAKDKSLSRVNEDFSDDEL